MCIPRPDDVLSGVGHRCIKDCRVCWILLVSNIRRLAAGETIQLGTVDDWQKPARNECRLTLALMELFLRSKYGPVGRSMNTA
jgi:hypothetical protein